MPETAASAVTPARVYPIPQCPDDPRFNMPLLLAFRALLVSCGYPRAEGVDLLHLQSALFSMLYAHPEPVDGVRQLQTLATPICLVDGVTRFCRTHQGQHPDAADERHPDASCFSFGPHVEAEPCLGADMDCGRPLPCPDHPDVRPPS